MLPKPKHCGEDWLAMQPAVGGRICGKCTKLIRDFSNCSWTEIERVQRENNYSVCGMYSPAQLRHWGQTSAPHQFGLAAPLLLATAAVSLLPGESGKAHAQAPAAQIIRQDTAGVAASNPADKPRQAARWIRFSGKAIHAETKEPLPGVNVLLKGTPIGAVCGHQGEFQLEVDAAELDSAGILVFSFIGFRAEEVPVYPATPGPFTVAMTADATNLHVFYVVKPSWPKRLWWKVKNGLVRQ
jgi:hypothetical protein